MERSAPTSCSALAALRADIDAKRRAWTDVVKLDARQKSLPSGTLQDWPDGAPLTVYSLAARMISQSDNTATDTLIRAIGREKIEPFAGRNVPYLTTREMFELKSPEGADVLAKFRAGDVTAKRAVLKELASRPLPALKTYPKTPTALDVEWYFSPRELCALMKRVHDLPLMGINPGVATRDDWSSVAYKGGSEPGVLSMTTWVEKGGHAHCVSASWNRDEKLDEGAFSLAYGTVLAWLAAH